MLRRGKYAVLCSTSSMSGEFCRRLRCRITCTFSQHQPAGMRPSAISQNGLNAGSTKRIALRIADRLCQRAPPRIGDGRKVVLIAYCDLMNRSRKNGNTSAKILCGLVSSSIQRTGPTSFNSTPNELASDTDALQSKKSSALGASASTTNNITPVRGVLISVIDSASIGSPLPALSLSQLPSSALCLPYRRRTFASPISRQASHKNLPMPSTPRW